LFVFEEKRRAHSLFLHLLNKLHKATDKQN